MSLKSSKPNQRVKFGKNNIQQLNQLISSATTSSFNNTSKLMPDKSPYHWSKVPLNQALSQPQHITNMLRDPNFIKLANSVQAPLSESWWRKALAFVRDGASTLVHHVTGIGKHTLGDIINEVVGGVGKIFDGNFTHEKAFGKGRSELVDHAERAYELYDKHKHHFKSLNQSMVTQSKLLDDLKRQISNNNNKAQSSSLVRPNKPESGRLLSSQNPTQIVSNSVSSSSNPGWQPKRVKRGADAGVNLVRASLPFKFENIAFSIPGGVYAAGAIVKSFPLTIVNFGTQFMLTAQNYRKIMYHKLEVRLQPLLSMTANGSLLGFFDPDPSQAWAGTGFGNVTRANTIQGVKAIPVMGSNSGSRDITVSCPLTSECEFFINSEVNGDSRLVIPGTFYLMAESSFDTTTLAPNTDIFLVSILAKGVLLDELTSTQTVSLNTVIDCFASTNTVPSGNNFGGNFVTGLTSSSPPQPLGTISELGYAQGSELAYHYRTSPSSVVDGTVVGLSPGWYKLEIEIQCPSAITGTTSQATLVAGAGAVVQQFSIANIISRTGSWTFPDGRSISASNNGFLISAVVSVPFSATGFGIPCSRPLDFVGNGTYSLPNLQTQANIGYFCLNNSSGANFTYQFAFVRIDRINSANNNVNYNESSLIHLPINEVKEPEIDEGDSLLTPMSENLYIYQAKADEYKRLKEKLMMETDPEKRLLLTTAIKHFKMQ